MRPVVVLPSAYYCSSHLHTQLIEQSVNHWNFWVIRSASSHSTIGAPIPTVDLFSLHDSDWSALQIIIRRFPFRFAYSQRFYTTHEIPSTCKSYQLGFRERVVLRRRLSEELSICDRHSPTSRRIRSIVECAHSNLSIICPDTFTTNSTRV